MNEPRNHHYVSQTHLKQFRNRDDKKIYLYDKKRDNFFYKESTRKIFSEKNLNTKYENGDIDCKSTEEELNNFFEHDYAKNLA